MGCCHYFGFAEGGANSFTVEMPRITFGRGTLRETGERARHRGITRAAVFTDPFMRDSAYVATVCDSLASAGVDFEIFSEVVVEPTDVSCQAAARFIAEGNFDGVVSVGGGSVLDTTKAAMVYALYPADFLTYFGPPIGEGVAVPGPLLPHIACPTTSGTGSEATALSVIRFVDVDTKFVLGHRNLFPVDAIVDPECLTTLPRTIIASSGFDHLSHAIECYTARAYTRWPKVDNPHARPPIQGANPWSDLHAREALRICGEYLTRGVSGAGDREALDNLMWAATLAGMAFGNTGTHLPHALSYAVSQFSNNFKAPDYPTEHAFVPHGISVIVNAPSVFRFTAQAAPERHLEAAACLGADVCGATPEDAGEIVAGRIIELMQATGMPNGTGEVGLSKADAAGMADSAIRQRRAIGNAPRETSRDDIERIFAQAVSYW